MLRKELYYFAALSSGFVKGDTRSGTQCHQNFILYNEHDLHFSIFFPTDLAREQFVTNLLVLAKGYGSESRPSYKIIWDSSSPVPSFSHLYPIASTHYNPNDYPDSGGKSIASSSHAGSAISNVNDNVRQYQSIEPHALDPAEYVEKCHLVHKTECGGNVRIEGHVVAKDNQELNLLGLTKSLHEWFDGHRNSYGYAFGKTPAILIDHEDDGNLRPYTIDSQSKRVKVYVVVSFRVDVLDSFFETWKARLNRSDVVYDDEKRTIGTYVWIPEDGVDFFLGCLRWKANDTMKAWEVEEDLINITAAVP
jgi:hypothetical protein